MAWLTDEAREHFTQFPNEPDMEALTYWVQRLEPIIRDESSDEIIVVFCNRTGMEDDAVYAGTSAVVGIHQGEVKVYGLLGRGVKELLVVDTDDPPFANLIIRKKKAYLSPIQYELKPSGQASDDDLLLKPSPVDSLERTPTRYRLLDDSPSIPAPTAPSPTPPSTRRRLSDSSIRSTEDQLDGPDAPSSTTCEPGRIFGGSVTVLFEDDGTQPEKDDEMMLSQYSHAIVVPGPPSNGPPLRTPQRSGTGANNSSSAKDPAGNDNNTRSTGPVDLNPPGRSSPVSFRPASKSPKIEDTVHGRPNERMGLTPPRSASPKSHNTSRLAQHRRRQSDATQVEGNEIDALFQQRSRPVVAARQDPNSASIQRRPRSPKSRNVSRSGHQFRFDEGLLERGLDSYWGTIPKKYDDQVLGPNAHATDTEPDNMTRNQDSKGQGAADASDQSDSFSGRCSSASARQTYSATADARLEPAVSDTIVWTEIAKAVGDRMRCLESEDGARGRRRSRSAGSNEVRSCNGGTPPWQRSTRSSMRQRDALERSGSTSFTPARLGSCAASNGGGARSPAPQTRHNLGNGGAFRSVRDPSLGPPSDPEDEIVAEITFRQPCLPPRGSTGAPDRRHWEISLRQKHDSVSSCGRLKRQHPSCDEDEKTPTDSVHVGNTTKQDLGMLSLQTSADDLSELRAPNLSRASIRTLSSYEPSPVTPPPRNFEPRNSKPTLFELGFGSMETSTLDLPSKVKCGQVNAALVHEVSGSS